MINPLLSVVIPTKNRFEYLVPSVQSILRITDAELEVIVCDNSEVDRSNDFLALVGDKRVHFYHISQRLDMVANYNHAISLARGDYIALIGDDDFIHRDILKIIRKFSSDVSVITTPPLANYNWADLNIALNIFDGQPSVNIRPFSSKVEFIELKDSVTSVVTSAGQHFTRMPKSYYGIVKREAFEKVRLAAGTYVPGLSPDMATSMALALVIDRVCSVDFPIFMPGSSLKSNAGLSGLSKHVGSLFDQKHLPQKNLENWGDFVPKFYSVQTVWAQACYEVLRSFERVDLMKLFNIPYIYALCYSYHFKLCIKENVSLKNSLQAQGNNYYIGSCKFWFYATSIFIERATSLFLRKIRIPKKSQSYVYNRSVLDIKSACGLLDSLKPTFLDK